MAGGTGDGAGGVDSPSGERAAPTGRGSGAGVRAAMNDRLKRQPCGHIEFNSEAYADALGQLVLADTLIDRMAAALESLQPRTLDLWQRTWLDAVREYRALARRGG